MSTSGTQIHASIGEVPRTSRITSSLVSSLFPFATQGCCKIWNTTLTCGSAEGDSPLPEREVSSLHPPFPPPADFAGECDSVAKRRHSQDRGKPCPYSTTARQARPS